MIHGSSRRIQGSRRGNKERRLRGVSNRNPLDFIERNLILPAIIELRGPRRLVVGDVLGCSAAGAAFGGLLGGKKGGMTAAVSGAAGGAAVGALAATVINSVIRSRYSKEHEKDLVAWIIPKDVLSLVFSTLGVV